jgi:hypothetical protein
MVARATAAHDGEWAEIDLGQAFQGESLNLNSVNMQSLQLHLGPIFLHRNSLTLLYL